MKLTKQEYDDLIRKHPNLKPVEALSENRSKVSDAKPKRHKKAALDSAIPRKEISVQLPRVCFTLHRCKCLDPDNAAGSVKDLLDGLRHAGLIEGDEWYRLKLEVVQEKVSHYCEEKTVIEIFKQ